MNARPIKLWAAAAGGLLSLLLVSAPASAVYQCGDQKDTCKCGGVPNPFPCCSNGGNCTWWGWEAACCHWHVDVPMRHDAKTWAAAAKADPNYKVLSYPVVNSIAVYDQGTWGHVAWVTAVHGNQIDVTEMKCGGEYGMHTNTYYASQFTGGFIVQANQQCACSAGQTDTTGCENCGHKSRTCTDGCNWDPWTKCQGQGSCTVGQKDVQACGTCGGHERWCGADCQWMAWGDCQGPDPAGGSQSCSTGLPGVCGPGTNRCVNGNVQCVSSVPASQEKCNALDDDCDGQTDEDNVCGGSPPPPPPQDASTGQDSGSSVDSGTGTPPTPEAGARNTFDRPSTPDGCACRLANGGGTSPATPWSMLIGLGCVGAWTLRRRRSRGMPEES